MDAKKFWVQKNFGSKKFCVQKYYGSEKNGGPKKIEPEKYFESKIFVPPLPYDIGLSKVGWIGRGGVGMGVPFLGFKGEHCWRRKIDILVKHLISLTPECLIFHRKPPFSRNLGFFIFF